MQYQLSDELINKLRQWKIHFPEIDFKYLDFIPKVVFIVISLPERHVLMVGIGPHFNGFKIDGVNRSCFVPYYHLHIRK